MLLPVAAREGRGDERLTCIIRVREPGIDRGKDFILNLTLCFLFLLSLLLIEPADIVLVDIDNTADDVAVALSGKTVIYDSEGVFKNAAGKDGVPKGISIIRTAEVSWRHDEAGRAFLAAYLLLACLTDIALQILYG